MDAASSAAFTAPGSPMASVPTGIPLGICTMDRSESRPFSWVAGIGTPSTGSRVFAATIPGRCAAGGAAHLPGMVAAKTLLPVLGVPIPATQLNGLDSLLSIVQMPRGIPVGTLAIGEPGAVNAALLAASIVALRQPDV